MKPKPKLEIRTDKPRYRVTWNGGERVFSDPVLMGQHIAKGTAIFRLSFQVKLDNPETAAHRI